MHGNVCSPGGSCGPEGEAKGKVCGWCKMPMGMKHNAHCTLYTLAVLTFVLGAVSLVGAWKNATWMGMDANALYHNATILFVLSVMFKMKKHWLKRELMAASMWSGCGEGGCCGAEGCGEGESGCGKEGCCKA